MGREVVLEFTLVWRLWGNSRLTGGKKLAGVEPQGDVLKAPARHGRLLLWVKTGRSIGKQTFVPPSRPMRFGAQLPLVSRGLLLLQI